MYTALILLIIFLIALRMCTSALLFEKELELPLWKGLIPVYSNLLMYKKIYEEKLNFAGVIMRMIAGIIYMAVVISQILATQIVLTHAYGLFLGFYTAPDYSNVWNIMMVVGGLLFIAGVLVRREVSKRFARLFGVSGAGINFLGMFLPSIFMFYLTMSKRCVFVGRKNPNDMARDEYLLYTTIFDEVQ